MPPDLLELLISANVEFSTFFSRVSLDDSSRVNPGAVWLATEPELPAISTMIEKVGLAIGHLKYSEEFDPETRSQVDLYTKNLHSLKNLLSCMLHSAEARRINLANRTGKIRETMSWLGTLQSTEID